MRSNISLHGFSYYKSKLLLIEFYLFFLFLNLSNTAVLVVGHSPDQGSPTFWRMRAFYFPKNKTKD